MQITQIVVNVSPGSGRIQCTPLLEQRLSVHFPYLPVQTFSLNPLFRPDLAPTVDNTLNTH